MVTRDLSAPDTLPPQLAKVAYRLPLGPVADRFLAFILDFLILSPVVSFFLATSLKDLKTLQLVNSESDSAVVIWLVFVFGIVVISCLLQSCFLYFWQATPGQKFMQLRVISFPPRNDSETITPGQALLRTAGWWGSVLLLGMPFLDVVGHPLRRGIHERMSDTLVVSLKQEYSDMPLPAETRSVGLALWVFFGFLFVMGSILMAKAYKAALLEGLSGPKTVAASNVCPTLLGDEYQEQRRLDMVIALFVSSQADEECVQHEAQKSLWTAGPEQKPLAELAMALVADNKEESANYQNKVCEDGPRSEACAISKFLRSDKKNRADDLRKSGLSLVSSRVFLLNDAMESGNYAAASSLIAGLQIEKPLRETLDRHLVRASWAVAVGNPNKKTGRQPASADESALLKQFKTRFGIQ